MKVNIYETVEFSDEQRERLGAVLSGALKPKYKPSRGEIKGFIWTHGAGWAEELEAAYRDTFEPETADDDGDEDDLIGTSSEDTEDYSDLI